MSRAKSGQTSVDLLYSLGLTDKDNGHTIQRFQLFEKSVNNTFNPPERAKIISASRVMSKVHFNQRRKDGSLYIEHPISVAIQVNEIFEHPNAEAVIAAIFHDTIEDQSKNFLKLCKAKIDPEKTHEFQALAVLKDRYGEEVSRLVDGLSNPNFTEELEKQGITTDHPDFNRRKRKLYAKHVGEIIPDPTLCIIKYADFSQNGLDLANLPDRKQKEKLCKKYRPIIELFESRIQDETRPLDTSMQSTMLLELQESRAYIDDYLTT